MKPRGHGGMPLWVIVGFLAITLGYVYVERHMFWQILISMGVVVGATEGAGGS